MRAGVDAELEALGPVPPDVAALVRRYAGDDLSLARADELLAALAGGVAIAAPARAPSVAPVARVPFPWESVAPEAPDEPASAEPPAGEPAAADTSRDTMEEAPVVTPRLSTPPGALPDFLESLLNESEEPPVPQAAAPDEPAEPAPAEASTGEPAPDADGDDFEILVDDEILEIQDDDVELFEEGEG